ncbi:MAG: prepilin-type N-terminal cleavage/methylation domain-containing protein [Planctomycetales bacterium]|nr:prepilin-type N-terminal cleavage/methylation domain-containing protein [Planctomycetales bacterium]
MGTRPDIYDDRRLSPGIRCDGLRRMCRRRSCRRGVSLMEVLVVLTVIGVLISMSAPSFTRSMEQAHVDVAGANLRVIWNAQRLYWLEHRAYADSLTTLVDLGLLDATVETGSSRYQYSIDAADADSFAAVATRINSTRWSGALQIDDTGTVSGTISASGENDMTPGFL